jgi:hypothetical protein
MVFGVSRDASFHGSSNDTIGKHREKEGDHSTTEVRVNMLFKVNSYKYESLWWGDRFRPKYRPLHLL